MVSFMEWCHGTISSYGTIGSQVTGLATARCTNGVMRPWSQLVVALYDRYSGMILEGNRATAYPQQVAKLRLVIIGNIL